MAVNGAIFTGFIDDVQQPDYMTFINNLRALATGGQVGSAIVHFSIKTAGFEEKFSPKLKIDFADNCYIHEFALGPFLPGFDFEKKSIKMDNLTYGNE